MTRTNPRARAATPPSGRNATVQLLQGQIGYRVLTALFWVVLARTSGPLALGEFAVANSLAVLVFVGLDAGLNHYLVREFRPGVGFPIQVRGIVRWRSALVVLGWAISGFGTAALVPGDTALATGLLVGAGYGIDFLCQAWLAPDRAELEMRPERRMKLVQGVVSLAGVLLIGALGTVDAVTASACVLAAYIVAAVQPLGRWRLKRRWVVVAVDGSQASPTQWRSAAAFAVTGILTVAYTRLDDLFVQVTHGAAAVAAYALAYKISETARLPSWAITRVVLARESSGREGGGPNASTLPFEVSMLVSGVAALACSLSGPWLTDLVFGHDYRLAGPALRILAISILLAGFTGPAQGFLLGNGRERSAATASLITTLAAILGLATLTPAYGTAGAAWAVVLAHAVTALTLGHLLRPHRLELFQRGIMIPFAIAFGALMVAAAVLPVIPGLVAAVALSFTALDVARRVT